MYISAFGGERKKRVSVVERRMEIDTRVMCGARGTRIGYGWKKREKRFMATARNERDVSGCRGDSTDG